MSVVIKQQNEVKVYTTTDGRVVVRQESAAGPSVVMFWPEYAEAIVSAIRSAASEDSEGA